MLAPGGGAGNLAAAIAQVKAVMPILHRSLAAAPIGGKEYKHIIGAIKELAALVGEAQDGNLVPAAAQQIMQAAKSGAAPLAAVAPGVAPKVPPVAGAPGPSPEAA